LWLQVVLLFSLLPLCLLMLLLWLLVLLLALLWLQVVLLVSLLLPLCLLLLLLWLLVQAVPSPRGPPLIPHSPGSRLGMLQRTQLRSQAAPLQAAPACKYVSGFMTSALRS
jgi:hypothetical protein